MFPVGRRVRDSTSAQDLAHRTAMPTTGSQESAHTRIPLLSAPRSPGRGRGDSLPALGRAHGPWARCGACEYFMSGTGGGLPRRHACPVLPLAGSLFICLMNYLSMAPLPCWSPPPPGPSLHDLLNTAQLCGCHPMSWELPWATQPEYSLCPRPVLLPASLAPRGVGVRHHVRGLPGV